MRTSRSSFRWAIAASVALHVALVVVIVAVVKRSPTPARDVIDTSAPETSVTFVAAAERTVAIPPEPIQELPAPPGPAQETGVLRPPLANSTMPVGDPVVDVAVTPATL